eukprot:TRINITY_DN4963_c0_g1_i1.p1 TRINITY_DN4963_c0_g1~~TRINITY_DN4963_c0_g1_i1.p1  ORF type:complete len:187 (+),score=52.53 TRINITY_DN4963_c0_g1_i1:255-815(+)
MLHNLSKKIILNQISKNICQIRVYSQKLNLLRNQYAYSLPIQTRWSDNDQYGHVNNVLYYSYFDTIVNHFLINEVKMNVSSTPNSNDQNLIGIVVETSCTYNKSLSFPTIIEAKLAISKIGRTSVTYQIGIFELENNLKEEEREREESLIASANGYFVHVYVDSITRKPTLIPNSLRDKLQILLIK